MSESILPHLQAMENCRTVVLQLKNLDQLFSAEMSSLALLNDALVGSAAIRSAIEATTLSLSPSAERIVGGLDHLDAAVEDIWAFGARAPDTWAALPSGLRDTPSLELYEASWSTAQAAGIEHFAADEPSTEEEFEAVTGVDLASRLAAIDGDLVDMYRGALASFERRDPDWPRQVAASLRELLSVLLRRLAPRDEVLSWNAESERTAKGELKRAARLKFLLCDVDHSYVRYAESDNDHIQQTALFLNEAVYRSTTDIGPAEYRLFIRRCGFAVHFLLDTTEL